MEQNLRTIDQNLTKIGKRFTVEEYLLYQQSWTYIQGKIEYILLIIQPGYYPFLAIFGVPGKSDYPIIYLRNRVEMHYSSHNLNIWK